MRQIIKHNGGTHYTSVNFLKINISKEVLLISDAMSTINRINKTLVRRGSILYNQMAKFVDENPDLYDTDFMNVKNPIVERVDIINSKCAIRLYVKHNDGFIHVLIPFLFISDPDEYNATRKRKLSFGDKTKKQVADHYDGAIDKLQIEIDRLKREKTSMSVNSTDWQ